MSSSRPQRSPALPSSIMRDLDRITVQEHGVPSLLLMENAGQGACRLARELAAGEGLTRIVVVAGPGNNGGDGLVLARHAHNEGFPVVVLLPCPPGRPAASEDVRRNLEMAAGCGLRVLYDADSSPAKILAAECSPGTLIVDALLGTGLRGAPRPGIAAWIDVINAAQAPVLALDIPSGLDADDGSVVGSVIQATMTATFAALKTGLVRGQGPRCSGEVRVVPISIPRSLLQQALAQHGQAS